MPNEKQSSDQLALLMQYTLFHIGVYITFGVGAASLIKVVNMSALIPAGVSFLLAGVAGAVITSSIPRFKDYESFKESSIGIWGWEPFRYPMWARLEHLCFWFGVIAGIIGLLLVP